MAGVTLDSMRVALRGILANRMRSALTMLGILIGTAAVILLVAVGTGISNQVQVQIRNLGTNAVYVLPERNPGGQDRGGTSARRIRLTKADVKALSDQTRAPSVDLVAPTVGSSGTLTWQGDHLRPQNFIGGSTGVRGDPQHARRTSGRFLTEEDVASHAKVAVIGTTVVDHLFPPGVDPVGQQVEFNGVRFRIVGLQVHKGSNGFQDQDDFMFAPITTVIDNIVGNVDSYTVIAARAVNKDAAAPGDGRDHHDPAADPQPQARRPARLHRLQRRRPAGRRQGGRQTVPAAARGRGRHLAAHRRDRGHEHHAGHRHRADPGDRDPQGAGRPTRATSSPSSWPRRCCWPASAG